jgi:hypothetical protein
MKLSHQIIKSFAKYYVIKTYFFILALQMVPLAVSSIKHREEVPDGEVEAGESSGNAQSQRCGRDCRTGRFNSRISSEGG